MDTDEILRRYRQQMRIEIVYPDMRKEVLPHIIRFTRPSPGRSIILFSELDEGNADALIQEQIDYFAQNRNSFDWKVYDGDNPVDLKSRLKAFGFESDLEEGDPGAILVKVLPAPEGEGPAQPTADVRRLTQKEQLKDVIHVLETVWGGDYSWITTRLGAHLQVEGYLSVYAVYVDEEPVTVGWTYFYPKNQFATLWGGSTVPLHRGAGLYTALLQARTHEAMQRGRRFLIIEASPMSRPIVERHGFRLLTHAESFALP